MAAFFYVPRMMRFVTAIAKNKYNFAVQLPDQACLRDADNTKLKYDIVQISFGIMPMESNV